MGLGFRVEGLGSIRAWGLFSRFNKDLVVLEEGNDATLRFHKDLARTKGLFLRGGSSEWSLWTNVGTLCHTAPIV